MEKGLTKTVICVIISRRSYCHLAARVCCTQKMMDAEIPLYKKAFFAA